MSKRLIFGGLLLLTFLAILGQAAVWGFFAYSPLKPGSPDSAVIEIQRKQGPREIAKLLVASGAIQDADSFVWVGRLGRKWKKIKAGEYKVSPAMTPLQLFGVITSGISIAHPITVREGENMYEIAADLELKNLVQQKTFLDLCKNPKLIASLGLTDTSGPVQTLEGYLFPDTYFFNKTLTAEEMVRQMVKRFHQAWTAAESARARELGMTRHQLVILASMIEKETGAVQERPMISSVFHNRLKKRMRLQSDPTTIYGIWIRYTGNLKKTDLLTETPFNTYTVPALPAGPISNPGKESIQAALFPATSEFLFFVSHNDGTHEFTKSFGDHNQAVKKFQLDPKAREGKSWRDLKRSKKAGT